MKMERRVDVEHGWNGMSMQVEKENEGDVREAHSEPQHKKLVSLYEVYLRA